MTPGHRRTAEAVPLDRGHARRPIGLALLAAALLAACGGSSDPGDTTPPTVTITDSVSDATATRDVLFTFTFSEDVGASFVAGDVTVTGGTKGAFTRVASTVYTLVVSPATQAAGTIEVTVAAGAFQDVAGNASTAATSANQAYDTRVALTQMALPVTFDSLTVEYGLLGFEGAEDSTIVVDPAGGTNKVARVVKSATAQTFAGTTLTAGATPGFSAKVPFTAADTRMTVRTWSPDVGIKVRLKVEDHTNPGVSVETEATTTAAGAWETLTFDFAAQATGTAALNLASTYDKATIFFNFGVAGAAAGAKTYYFDDVVFIGGGGTGGGGAVPFATVTFDDPAITYGLTGFAGADASTVEVDPAGGPNKVVKVLRAADAQVFAGTTFSTGANATVGVIPFTAADTRMTVRTWSPAVGLPVRLKVENHAAGAVSVETEAVTTVAGAWETLTFDFAANVASTPALDLGATYDKATIFFNFGATGAAAGAQTFYFDDATFIGGGGTGGGGAVPFATVTFDDPAITYGLTGFAGADASTVEVDPAGGPNKVVKVLRAADAQVFAGTTFSTGANATVGVIPFTAADTRMTVRTWSPAVGLPVRLKVENHAAGAVSVETEAVTTVAGAWETLTFDFAANVASTPALDLGATYDKATIFFNFGATGAAAGAQTFYFDDATFIGGGGTGGGAAVPFATITFDDGGVAYLLTDFEGATGGAVVSDPAGGLNLVARAVKPASAQPWAGTTVTTHPGPSAGKIPFDATHKKMTVRVWSPDAGIAVRLKVEDHADATKSVETEAVTTVAGAWETLTFDFATQAPGTAALVLTTTYDKVSIFFNFLVATVGADKTYYYDDIAFVP